MSTKENFNQTPFDPKLEAAVLSQLMLEPNVMVDVGFLNAEMFYETKHQLVFKAIKHTYENSKTDLITVTQHLKSENKLHDVGGVVGITNISNVASSAMNLEQHARILQELHMRRQVIDTCLKLTQQAYRDDEDVFDVVTSMEQSVQNLTDVAALGGSARHISYAVGKTLEALEERAVIAAEGGVVGIPTGIKGFDIENRGLQNSNLIILAGRPGMGKTAIALKFLKTAAQHGYHAAFFSLEMSEIELTQRLISSVSFANTDKMKSGKLENEDWEQIHQAANRLDQLPITIDDTPSVSMSYIRNQSRSLHKKGECDMIIIDYLQLLRPDEKKTIREQEVAEMSRSCKILAKELDIPVVLLCQLSREVEKRGGNKEPILSDLRESGAIEQDADLVLFAYRPEYYGIVAEDIGNPLSGVGKLIGAKNRHGKTGEIKFTYNHNLTKFDE